MIERISKKTKSVLILEQRVPATHSAMPAEHEWHHAKAEHVDVTDMAMPGVLAAVEVLRLAVAKRPDYETRVVLVNTETNRTAINPKNCAHEMCTELIERGEQYAVHNGEAYHLECRPIVGP